MCCLVVYGLIWRQVLAQLGILLHEGCLYLV
jgi:hypothetical protein